MVCGLLNRGNYSIERFYPLNLTFKIAATTKTQAKTIVNLNKNCSMPRLDLNVVSASPKRFEPDPRACSKRTTIIIMGSNISVTLKIDCIVFCVFHLMFFY